MSNPRAPADGGDNRSSNNNNSGDAAVAKTAGFVVFSGIAMSILKTLNPFNKQHTNNNESIRDSLAELTDPIRDDDSLPSPPEPLIKKPSTWNEPIVVPETLPRTIEIVRGDTLWGLSRKYGVSIEAIKEANGLTGDTIYAGKKLVIP